MANRRLAIVQSNYIPWKGYFDLIASVDEFILYDDMQFTRRDWRNRNQIKTPQGPQWLTIPVKVKGKYFQKINETETDGDEWASGHWKAIRQNYAKAPHFKAVSGWVEDLYASGGGQMLSAVNRRWIEAICGYLDIGTQIRSSAEFALAEGKSERLLDLCLQRGAATYVSGPAARDYLDEDIFTAAGVQVEWFDYAGYEPYPQLWGEFVHGVTILDLILNCGAEARRYMKAGVR